MLRKILVCLDGSKLAEQIISYSAAIALAHQAKMVLFRVMPMPVAVAPGAPGVPVETPLTPEIEAEAKGYLFNIAGSLTERGVRTEVVVQKGPSAGVEIVNYANENAIDLIALATHGRSGLGRAVFGSVADFVLRVSGLPILLIKPKAIPSGNG